MSNTEIVEKFLTSYQNDDYHGMQSYLDEKVQFSDYAFDIHGGKVRALWHWFNINYSPRKQPINVPEFDIIEAKRDNGSGEISGQLSQWRRQKAGGLLH